MCNVTLRINNVCLWIIIIMFVYPVCALYLQYFKDPRNCVSFGAVSALLQFLYGWYCCCCCIFVHFLFFFPFFIHSYCSIYLYTYSVLSISFVFYFILPVPFGNNRAVATLNAELGFYFVHSFYVSAHTRYDHLRWDERMKKKNTRRRTTKGMCLRQRKKTTLF